MIFRSAVADGIQVPRLGNPIHIARHVFISHASHPAPLQGSTAVTPAFTGCRATDESDPIALMVNITEVTRRRRKL